MKYSINLYDAVTGEKIGEKGTNFVSLNTFLSFIDTYTAMETEQNTDSSSLITKLMITAIPTLTEDEVKNNCDFSELLEVFNSIVNSAKAIKQSKN